MNKTITAIITLALLAIGYYTSSSLIEIIGSVTGLFCVYLNAKENIWNYPIGIINIVAFIYMFSDAKLYADMMLQVYFLVLTLIGWRVWLTKKGDNAVRPTRNITKKETLFTFILIPIITVAWGYVLQHFTDASIPYLDSFIATVSLVAQYFLSNKVLQNWLFWIFVDVLSIGMYFYKGLSLVGALYITFLIIAIYGWFSWKKEFDAQ